MQAQTQGDLITPVYEKTMPIADPKKIEYVLQIHEADEVDRKQEVAKPPVEVSLDERTTSVMPPPSEIIQSQAVSTTKAFTFEAPTTTEDVVKPGLTGYGHQLENEFSKTVRSAA